MHALSDLFALRDVQIFMGAAFLACGAAWWTVRNGSEKNLLWPTRVLLFILGPLAPSDRSFSRREQSGCAWFVWFFLFFVLGVAWFGCGRFGCR